MALRARVQAHLETNWRNDLCPVWRTFFMGVEPDINGLPDWRVDDLFPDRLNLGRERNEEDPPPQHHMLRAFDRLAPDQVRVVIIGQDPYPRRRAATGRAFEDGEWDEGNPTAVADSLQRLLQSAAAYEHPDLGISEERSNWGGVCAAIRDGALTAPATPNFFDAWAGQGVLCVNAAWTFTSPNGAHLKAHINVWFPVMRHLLLVLATRDDQGPIVFLHLGKSARNRFRAATWRHFRTNPQPNVGTVYCAHPTSWTGRTYFDYANPLRRVNETLVELGANPIQWWPPVNPVEFETAQD